MKSADRLVLLVCLAADIGVAVYLWAIVCGVVA